MQLRQAELGAIDANSVAAQPAKRVSVNITEAGECLTQSAFGVRLLRKFRMTKPALSLNDSP